MAAHQNGRFHGFPSHAVFVNLRKLQTIKTNWENVAYVLWETANPATVKRDICTRVPACYEAQQFAIIKRTEPISFGHRREDGVEEEAK